MYPVLFKIPFIDLPIYSYGVMLGLSLVVGWYVVMYLGSKNGLPADKLANCYIWTAVSALLGSRILYIITNLSEYQDAGIIDLLNVRKGGLVAYGGFLGGFFGSWVYLKKQRIRLLPWADVVVPSLGSGLGITRIGCFLYGCDFGKPIPADAPGWIQAIGLRFPNWSIRFPELAEQFRQGTGCMSGQFQGSPAFYHHVRNLSLAKMDDVASALVYPTQLLEVANGWIAFVLTLLVHKKARFRGQAFLFFTAYYGVTRALFEIIRGDTQRGGIGIFSTSQIIGVTTFTAAAIAYYFLARQAKADPIAAMDLGPGAVVENTAADDSNKPPEPRVKRRKKK
ncbi:MAG: prolipoprotein diacylglyceryl transferase [Deltaproteobacteria bacterium]|nr:prolipoprotein diacylglyceryl transferase [Deltaproteobacteria bacterium]